MKKDVNAYYRSFVFSLCYVGLATIALFSLFPDSILRGDWSIYALFFTLPASIVGFGLLYGDISNGVFIVLTTQIIMFFVIWSIVYRIMRKK